MNINGYEIVEELNKGAFCDAYKVRKGGKEYFLKVYKDPTAMSADYEAFKKNQRTMIPLLKSMGDKTETIVEDFEVPSEGRYYQVKELIPGGRNLRQWMEEDCDYDHRMDVAIQFCEILKAVHGKNIIHQDLKPEQVMVVTDSSKAAGIRIILTDFDWSVPNGNVVRYVGTPGYNNIDGVKLSFKSDIFTFGIILCELLAGCNPFVFSKSGSEHLFDPDDPKCWENWVRNKDYYSPKELNSDLPDAINNIIEQCFEPIQSLRPSLDDIVKALIGKPSAPAARKKATLSSKSGDKLIMVPGMTYGRKHFKELFRNTEDSEGNPVYKYLDQTYGILSLTQEGSQLFVSYPAYGKAKNKIKLNGKELSDKPNEINDGDSISIYSTTRNADVAVFSVRVS